MSKLFTDLTIKKLPIGKHFDASTPAFGMRVGKNRRTWIVQRGADRRIIRVGHYPAMTLAEARAKGKQLLASTQLNLDRVSFEEAYELFKKTHLPRLKERTQADYKRFLERYYLPTLAKRRLDAITSHMVNAITDDLVDTPAEQSHAIAIGKTFFRWCVRRHYLNRSPLEGATLPKQTSRDRVLTDEELVAVWRAAERMPGHFGTIVRLLILTGMRRGECAAIQTSWITNTSLQSSTGNASDTLITVRDLAITKSPSGGSPTNLWTLTIPKEVTKNGRELCLPIGNASKSILASLTTRETQSTFLFPARPKTNAPFSGFSQSKKNLDKLLNIAPFSLHDIRRTYRTNLARLGVAPHIAERLVNHVSSRSDVERIYDQFKYWDEMKEAVTKYDDWFQKLLAR